jgi:DNA-directed RNA polymerase
MDLGVHNPFGDKLMYASEYLASAIWTNIESTVIKAKEAMKWLKNISKLAAKMNIPINWKVCTGFWVQQHYQEVNHRRIETKLGDKIIKLTITEDKKKINKRRQAQGISANFVHSLDAAAMMLTVNKCRTKGITDFQMIHDSYGTHATNIETMGQCLREVFVEMFEENVLETFRDHIYGILSPKLQAKLTPIPEMGKLNIHDVKDSKYFFA